MNTFSCNKLNLVLRLLAHFQLSDLISFSFLVNLCHKETEYTSFVKKFLQIICIQLIKKMLTFLAFLNYTSGYLKFCKDFRIFEMAWSGAFQKCIFYHFWRFFLVQIYVLYNWILRQTKSIYKFAKFRFLSRFLK